MFSLRFLFLALLSSSPIFGVSLDDARLYSSGHVSAGAGGEVDNSAEDIEEKIEPDRSAIEVLVETAKVRAVMDDPDKGGGPARFSEISPYILINGVSPSDISEIETRAGTRLLSLGTYPHQVKGEWTTGAGVEWGSAIATRVEVEDYHFSEEEKRMTELAIAAMDGDEGAELRLQQNYWEAMLGDSALLFQLPGPDLNPSRHISIDSGASRTVLYTGDGALLITDKFFTQGFGGKNEFLYFLEPEEEEFFRTLLSNLREGGRVIPPIHEQVLSASGGRGTWERMEKFGIAWRNSDGEVDFLEMLLELDAGDGRDPIRGGSFSFDDEKFVRFLRSIQKPQAGGS